jgi:hypothetical protein
VDAVLAALSFLIPAAFSPRQAAWRIRIIELYRIDAEDGRKLTEAIGSMNSTGDIAQMTMARIMSMII